MNDRTIKIDTNTYNVKVQSSIFSDIAFMHLDYIVHTYVTKKEKIGTIQCCALGA